MMNTDLILKYRPRRFDEFWTQREVFIDMPDYIRNRCLPKCLVFSGTFGTAKTTTACLVGQAASCLDTSSPEPCYQCDGCRFVDAGLFTYGARLVFVGGAFKADWFRKAMWGCEHYVPPQPYNMWSVIIDEADLLPDALQAEILHCIEDVERAFFIFCTTRPDTLNKAILDRAHNYVMPHPTEQEAAVNLMKIAVKEGLHLPESAAVAIARANHNLPRKCLKELQRLKGTGRLGTLE